MAMAVAQAPEMAATAPNSLASRAIEATGRRSKVPLLLLACDELRSMSHGVHDEEDGKQEGEELAVHEAPSPPSWLRGCSRHGRGHGDSPRPANPCCKSSICHVGLARGWGSRRRQVVAGGG